MDLPRSSRPPLDAAPEGALAAATRRFPATPSSVSGARRFLLEQLPADSRDIADELILMVSELATNAVQHAGAPFEMSVAVDPIASRVRVDVRDPSDGTPARQGLVSDAPHGRGLHIIATLADAWGIEMRRDRPGKTVWFSAALPVGLPVGPATNEGALPVPEPGWPARGVQTVLDGLSDAVIANRRARDHPVRQRCHRRADGLAGQLTQRTVRSRTGSRRADGINGTRRRGLAA